MTGFLGSVLIGVVWLLLLAAGLAVRLAIIIGGWMLEALKIAWGIQ